MEQYYDSAARQFQIRGSIESVTPFGEGHIHESFLVKIKEEDKPDYLLQKKNKYVFRDVPSMMDNINRVTRYLQKKIREKGGDPNRETLALVPALDGRYYYLDPAGEYWAMCVFIKNSITYLKLESSALATAGGREIGRFQAMLADFDEPLADILPGYHNMKYRFRQWDQALGEDRAGLKKTIAREIAWIEERRGSMLRFWDLIESGYLPRRVAHNDTKISNILFDLGGNAICVIDLDTVMRSTVLNDFGDSIRTYTNTGDEDDTDLDRVKMGLEIYRAYTEGYLSEAKSFLSSAELEHLAFSAHYITFEQVLRFLMDYIDGDRYYRVHYPEHNLVRTRAQYRLLQSMEEQLESMQQIVLEFSGPR